MDNDDFFPWFMRQIYSPSKKEKRNKLIDDYIKGLITGDEFKQKVKEIERYYES